MNRTLPLLVLGLALLGCEKRRETTVSAIQEDDRTYVAMVVLDLSGSFSHLMADRGKGYEFALTIVDRYFRDRIGTADRLVVAQISGTQRSLLWEGTPHELRQDFATAGRFRDFLLSKAEPDASFVNEGLTHAIQYLLSDAAVASGQAKPAVFVLSDMVDNGTNTIESERKLKQTLAAYAETGGVMGIYYVDQLQVAAWRTCLRECGIPGTVESEIHGRPTLPSFE
jgi:hypothetical protein